MVQERLAHREGQQAHNHLERGQSVDQRSEKLGLGQLHMRGRESSRKTFL